MMAMMRQVGSHWGECARWRGADGHDAPGGARGGGGARRRMMRQVGCGGLMAMMRQVGRPPGGGGGMMDKMCRVRVRPCCLALS